jgi:hypothetical protein
MDCPSPSSGDSPATALTPLPLPAPRSVPKSGVHLRVQCQNTVANKLRFYTLPESNPTWMVFPLGPGTVIDTTGKAPVTKTVQRYRIIGFGELNAEVGESGAKSGFSKAKWYLHAVENGDR